MKMLYSALGDHLLTKDIPAENMVKTETMVVEKGEIQDLTPLPDRTRHLHLVKKSPNKKEA